jgi:hypothetical protein
MLNLNSSTSEKGRRLPASNKRADERQYIYNEPGQHAATAAIAAASLMGPAQVAARIIEYGAKRWSNPLVSAKVANALHPVATVALMLGGASSIAWFALIHGAGNGILTMARDTLPLALFEPRGYGARIGKIAAPGRIGQAVAPFLFGVVIERFGVGLLAVSCALSLAAFLALFRHEMSSPGSCAEAM